MGDIFSMGFGPFRWVCTSCSAEDLMKTDKLSENVIQRLLAQEKLPESVKQQYRDNLKWIQQAENHKLVVGSQVSLHFAYL